MEELNHRQIVMMIDMTMIIGVFLSAKLFDSNEIDMVYDVCSRRLIQQGFEAEID